MRFWKIEELKSDLASQALRPSQALQYYVVAGAISILMYGLPLYEQNVWDVVGTIGDSVLLIAGGYFGYRANGGSAGVDFLGRFISIMWVVSIRLLVLLMIPLIALGIALEAYMLGSIPDVSTPFEAVLVLVLEAVVYWRVAVHLDDTARRSAA